jgi:hypothetical protein
VDGELDFGDDELLKSHVAPSSEKECRTRQTVETENDRNGRDDICAMTA